MQAAVETPALCDPPTGSPHAAIRPVLPLSPHSKLPGPPLGKGALALPRQSQQRAPNTNFDKRG